MASIHRTHSPSRPQAFPTPFPKTRLMMPTREVGSALDTVQVESGAEAEGQSTGSLRLRQQTGATVIAVVREGQAFANPQPDYRFRAGDTVVLVGDKESLQRGVAWFRARSTERAPEGTAPDPREGS